MMKDYEVLQPVKLPAYYTRRIRKQTASNQTSRTSSTTNTKKRKEPEEPEQSQPPETEPKGSKLVKWNAFLKHHGMLGVGLKVEILSDKYLFKKEKTGIPLDRHGFRFLVSFGVGWRSLSPRHMMEFGMMALAPKDYHRFNVIVAMIAQIQNLPMQHFEALKTAFHEELLVMSYNCNLGDEMRCYLYTLGQFDPTTTVKRLPKMVTKERCHLGITFWNNLINQTMNRKINLNEYNTNVAKKRKAIAQRHRSNKKRKT